MIAFAHATTHTIIHWLFTETRHQWRKFKGVPTGIVLPKTDLEIKSNFHSDFNKNTARITRVMNEIASAKAALLRWTLEEGADKGMTDAILKSMVSEPQLIKAFLDKGILYEKENRYYVCIEKLSA